MISTTDKRIKTGIKYVLSVMKEISKAGGDLSLERLEEMSALEFLILLSTNNIQIKYTLDKNINDLNVMLSVKDKY